MPEQSQMANTPGRILRPLDTRRRLLRTQPFGFPHGLFYHLLKRVWTSASTASPMSMVSCPMHCRAQGKRTFLPMIWAGLFLDNDIIPFVVQGKDL